MLLSLSCNSPLLHNLSRFWVHRVLSPWRRNPRFPFQMFFPQQKHYLSPLANVTGILLTDYVKDQPWAGHNCPWEVMKASEKLRPKSPDTSSLHWARVLVLLPYIAAQRRPSRYCMGFPGNSSRSISSESICLSFHSFDSFCSVNFNISNH